MGYGNGDWPAHLVPDLTLDIEQIMSTVAAKAEGLAVSTELREHHVGKGENPDESKNCSYHWR